jgi:hypothetical protein
LLFGLLTTHEQQYNDILKTEALECLLVLLYEHVQPGVLRCYYLYMLLAFERQAFFVVVDDIVDDTDTSCTRRRTRNAFLVSIILAGAMSFWCTFPTNNLVSSSRTERVIVLL